MKVGIASLGEGGGFFGGSLIWDMEVGRSDRCFLGSSSGPNSLVWATVFGPERVAKGLLLVRPRRCSVFQVSDSVTKMNETIE